MIPIWGLFYIFHILLILTDIKSTVLKEYNNLCGYIKKETSEIFIAKVIQIIWIIMQKNVIRIVIRNTKQANVRCMASKADDVVTHTGQKWDCRDYRMCRFMHSPKLVNPNWPVKLVAAIPPTKVTCRIVWCDGGSGPEGHPRVYINLDKPGPQYCMYCSAGFIKVSQEEMSKSLCKK